MPSSTVGTIVGQIQRYYGYFFVDHDQQLFGDRVHLDIRTPVGGLENRATVGFKASTLDFERGRGFRSRWARCTLARGRVWGWSP